MTEWKSTNPTSSISQRRIAAMKNVLADGRLTQKRGGGGSLRPNMYPTPGQAWGIGGGWRVCQGSPSLAPLPLFSTPTQYLIQLFEKYCSLYRSKIRVVTWINHAVKVSKIREL